MSVSDNLVVYAINDLRSLQDSLREITKTLETESAGGVEDVIDHIEEMLGTAEGAAANLVIFLSQKEAKLDE